MSAPAKYQIFVSSTYKDLKDERDQVIKATLEMGHIPVGMEMFSAADEAQWKVITRQIDQSDYYVVIVAHRYGSVVRGVSFTEKEYNYAVERGVPVIGFVIKDSASWPTDADHVEEDQQMRRALQRFKTKVERKPVDFWSSAEELYGKYAIALGKLIYTNPRPGWVRASEATGSEVVGELSRLSVENATLRHENADLREKLRPGVIADAEQLAQGDESTYVSYYRENDETEWQFSATWDELFKITATEAFLHPDNPSVAQALRETIAERSGFYVRSPNIPTHELAKIKAQFIALGLVEDDRTSNSWTLTERGRRKLIKASVARRS